jgi:hypothetical protein
MWHFAYIASDNIGGNYVFVIFNSNTQALSSGTFSEAVVAPNQNNEEINGE